MRARHAFLCVFVLPRLILLSVIFLVKCVDIFLSLFGFDMNVNVVRLSIQSFVEIRFTNFYYTLMNWEPGLGGAAAADVVVEKNEADVETFFASSELQLTISIDDKRVIRCLKKCRSVFVTRIQ